jgi:hypothetical protein
VGVVSLDGIDLGREREWKEEVTVRVKGGTGVEGCTNVGEVMCVKICSTVVTVAGSGSNRASKWTSGRSTAGFPLQRVIM